MFLIQNCPQRKIADLNSGKILYCFVQSRKTFTVKGNKLIQTHRHTHTHTRTHTLTQIHTHTKASIYVSRGEEPQQFLRGIFCSLFTKVLTMGRHDQPKKKSMVI